VILSFRTDFIAAFGGSRRPLTFCCYRHVKKQLVFGIFSEAARFPMAFDVNSEEL
jgi:hypothetical protein